MLSEEYALSGKGMCSMCKGRLVADPTTEETVCSLCGIVYEEEISLSQGSLLPLAGEVNHLGGTIPGMKYDLDLPTMIGLKNTDVRGNAIASSYDLNRLRRLNNVGLPKDSDRKSITRAIDMIRRITERLNAGSAVAERAYQIYQKSNGADRKRRKAIANAAMASVYVACKELGIPRTSKEIDDAIRDVNPKGVKYYSNSIQDELQIEENTPEAVSFVSRIAARAGLSGRTERKSIEILQSVKGDIILVGKRPVPIAAASLYLAASLCGEHMTLSKISCFAEVTPITVRKRSIEIGEILSKSMQTEAAS